MRFEVFRGLGRLSAVRRARALGTLGVALGGVLPAACSNPTSSGGALLTKSSSVLFLVQTEVPAATMDALANDRVVRDEAGCLRLAGPDGHTVVWPYGYSLRTRGAALAVVDAQGRERGVVGGQFSLGGGEALTLPEGVGVSDADRQAALQRCPGRFWITGSLL